MGTQHACLCCQVNKKGLKLQCSHYKPSGASPEHALPIVIYCHCNSGSRRDAEEAFYVLLPHNITVFCLDFAVSSGPVKEMLKETSSASLATVLALHQSCWRCRGLACQMETG